MGILIAVLVMWGLFKLTSFVFTILMYLTPVLLIATAILDFNTLKGYGKNIGKLFSQNTVVGVLAIVATVIGFPFISAYLFAKALLKKKERDAQEKAAKGPIVGDYVKFEDVALLDEEIVPESESEEAIIQSNVKREDSDYDQLFD